MHQSHPRSPSLLQTLVVALLLSTAGQALLSADPAEKKPAAPTTSSAEQPKNSEKEEAPPAPSSGTLLKKKKRADTAPSKTIPEEDTPPAKPSLGKASPADDKPLKVEGPSIAPGKGGKPVEPGKNPVAPEDEALLKSLDKEEEPDDVERLERAISGMREAQQRIEERDASKKTQDIQNRVVKDLAILIDALQNPKGSPPDQNNQDQQDQNQKQKQKKQQGKQGKRRRQLSLMNRQQQSRMREQQQQQRRDNRTNQEDQPPEKSQDTSGSLAKTKPPVAEKDRQQQLVKDVWGHLPPNVRAELLNVFSEKYLPKYEDLVRRYYEALAEKNRARGPGR